MHAIVHPSRIDIEGVNGLPKDKWEPLLDELKAVHMPRLMLTGRRMLVTTKPTGRVDAFIYRTGLTDQEVVSILAKYGIVAFIEDDLKAP
jgi:hypothetical protein